LAKSIKKARQCHLGYFTTQENKVKTQKMMSNPFHETVSHMDWTVKVLYETGIGNSS